MESILFIAAPFTSLFFAVRFHNEGRGWLLGFLYGLFLSPIALVHAAIIFFKVDRSKLESFAAKVRRSDAAPDVGLDHGRQPPHSIEDCTRAIDIYPNEPYLYQVRGEAYHEQSRYEDAVADFSKAIRLEPNDPSLYHARGLAWFGLHRFDAATADFSAAIELWPDYPGFFLSRGLAYKNQAMYDRAIKDLNQAIKLDPHDASQYHYLGECWIKFKEYDAAIDSFSKAIDIDPEAETLTARGDTYFQMGEFNRALEDYENTLRLSPSADAYSSRGSAYQELGEQEKALSDFRTALSLDPLRPDILVQMGNIYLEREDLKGAIEQFTQGMASLPDYFKAPQDQVQRPEQEMEVYDVVVMSIADLHYLRAMCHFLIGDNRQAMEDYDAAIRLNPDEAKFYHGRGGCHSRNEDQDRAIDDLGRAIVLSSNSESTHDTANSYSTRGIAFFNKDDYGSALRDFETAIGLQPNQADHYAGRGACRLHLGQYQTALCDLDMAVELVSETADTEQPGEFFRFHVDPWFPHALRGLAHSLLDHECESKRDFQRAVELGTEQSHMKTFLKELVPKWNEEIPGEGSG